MTERAPLTRNHLRIIGFGLYRQQIDQPWFAHRDFNRYYWSLPLRADGRANGMSPSGFCRIASHLLELGYVENLRLSGDERKGNDAPRSFVRTTDQATPPMVASIAHFAIHEDLSVHEIFLDPIVSSIVTELITTPNQPLPVADIPQDEAALNLPQ